jgi:hypothetical protein
MLCARRLKCWPGFGLACLIAVWLTACQSTSRKELGSPNPLERAQAAVCLAEAGDAGAVHELVDLLEDSDRAVRMYAILALVRLTGADYGYKYYGTDLERAVAVRRWRDALRAGEVVVRHRTTPSEAEPEASEAKDPSISVPTTDDQETASGSP